MQPVLSPIERIRSTSSGESRVLAGQRGELGALVLDGTRARARLLDQRRHHAADGLVREVPLARELDHRQAGPVGDRPHGLEALAAGLDPACRAKVPVVLGKEFLAGEDVVEEQPAVVDDPRDHAHVAGRRGGEAQLTGPRLQRIEDDHRPVDQLAKALEAVDHVQREAVRGTGSDADHPREPGIAQRGHPVPDGLAGVTRAVGVVQQEQIEGVDPATLEAALGRHPQVTGVLGGLPQPRVGEAREALGAVALSLIEIMADGPDHAHLVPLQARQPTAEHQIGLAGPVHVGGDHGADRVIRSDQGYEAVVVERLSETHEAPAAPRPHGGRTGIEGGARLGHAMEFMAAPEA